MAKKLVYELTGELPDDAMEAAEITVKLKPIFAEFSKTVRAAGLEHVHLFKQMTVKAGKGTQTPADAA